MIPTRIALTVFATVLAILVSNMVYAELPRVLIHRGERFLAMGKLPAAIANYSQVIKCCEGSIEAAEAHNDLGVVYARQGDTAKAMEEYHAALKGPQYPLAHFNLGKAHAQLYQETKDETDRKTALAHFSEFRRFLSSAQNLPAVISYQQEELMDYIDSTEQILAASEK